MPCASVYWTLVLRRLLSLSESVAHRSEKFFMVEWLDEESHRADSNVRRVKGFFDLLLRFHCFACDDKA